MRKLLLAIIICMIGAMLLEGCGAASDSNTSDKPKGAEKKAEVTDTITITITGAKSGAKYDDTCASEVWVY